MREQVRTRAVGSLAGQMFVVHEVMGIENPVTREGFHGCCCLYRSLVTGHLARKSVLVLM